MLPLPTSCLVPRASFLTSQQGALFGLDARIALAVFSLISIVAGAAMVMNLDSSSAKALAQELADTTRAIEAYHTDLKADVYQTLATPSERTAFEALFNVAVLSDEGNFQGRWNGPYIKFTSARHTKYGEMVLKKRADTHTEECTESNICHLWLVYGAVKKGIVEETNALMDGEKETNPATSGRIQWSPGEKGNLQLYYRSARALTPTTE